MGGRLVQLPVGQVSTRLRLGVAALAALAGCEAREAPPARPLPDNPYVEAAERDVGLALTGDGLVVIAWSAGRSEPLPFGTALDRTLDALAPLRGEPARRAHAVCDAQAVRWPDGLVLWVADGALVGWTVDGRQPGADRIATLDGFGVGSTRAEMAMLADVEGASFEIDGVSGRLDGAGPTARVTALRAGEGCEADG